MKIILSYFVSQANYTAYSMFISVFIFIDSNLISISTLASDITVFLTMLGPINQPLQFLVFPNPASDILIHAIAQLKLFGSLRFCSCFLHTVHPTLHQELGSTATNSAWTPSISFPVHRHLRHPTLPTLLHHC